MFSGRKGNREYVIKPDGYQRTLRECHRILHKTNARITGLDWTAMHLEEFTEEDFVYIDAPYIEGNVRCYTADSLDHRALLRLLEKARFRWLLSEYPHPLYFQHFGDPCHVEDVQLLCVRGASSTTRTECLWKNY
jgi:site-specific DNA-adenine methylase